MNDRLLSEIEVGPLLRGVISAAVSPPEAMLPGPRLRFVSVGTDGAADRGTSGPDDMSLRLSEPISAASVVADFDSFLSGCGEIPRSVLLPSGSRWAVDGSVDERRSSAVDGKVALVSGSAQGFGWEIARGFAREGAAVALADIRRDGVRARAAELGDLHEAFEVDVTREESVSLLVDQVSRRYGGIDILVSNAGVLRAGSVTELSLQDFRFVTEVNYLGFFIMTKFFAPVMALQHLGASAWSSHTATSGTAQGRVGSPYLTDIIEVNSKSGLVGSNRNSAYAGSKFGGIGLVQSFALELVEQGTKVNAVCPGNFLDGPLWSDPENGLFVQYLRAGKVPGARTIADVRRFYEEKVPMKRGCTGRDVLRAILYLVDQQYETGQALPVTGGQVMLS